MVDDGKIGTRFCQTLAPRRVHIEVSCNWNIDVTVNDVKTRTILMLKGACFFYRKQSNFIYGK